MLRQKARIRLGNESFISLKADDTAKQDVTPTGHINFFQEVEEGTAEYKKANKEHDKEKKEEQEKYEKQIGYLTYLGQDTNEALGKKNWYDVAPDRSSTEKGEVNMKSKKLEDPLNVIKKYTNMPQKGEKDAVKAVGNIFPIVDYQQTEKEQRNKKHKHRSSSGNRTEHSPKKKRKKKHKKHKSEKKKRKSSSSECSEVSEDEITKAEKARKLEILRMERLRREQEERKKSELLLAKLTGKVVEKPSSPPKQRHVKQKYNSQFNPELAKQNYD